MSNLMRQAFADTMLEIGQKDNNLVVLIGDISHFILQPFAKECPERFYNIGICEQTIVNMAAGLSKTGFYPVVHTISPFIIERAFEQIKVDFGYQKLGVNLVTVGSAFDYSTLGCTHHCYDDFALLKNIQGIEIIYPGSPIEFNLLFKQRYNNGLPTYFRLPAITHDVIFKKEQIKFGKGITVKVGKNLTIIALGSQLKTAMLSVAPLKDIGIDAEIIYLPTIKPLDEKLILKSLAKTKKCLVIEEHGKYGGVYDDVLRLIADTPGMSVKCSSINIGDKFIHEYGSYEDHCNRLGLTPENIVKKVKSNLLS